MGRTGIKYSAKPRVNAGMKMKSKLLTLSDVEHARRIVS